MPQLPVKLSITRGEYDKMVAYCLGTGGAMPQVTLVVDAWDSRWGPRGSPGPKFLRLTRALTGRGQPEPGGFFGPAAGDGPQYLIKTDAPGTCLAEGTAYWAYDMIPPGHENAVGFAVVGVLKIREPSGSFTMKVVSVQFAVAKTIPGNETTIMGLPEAILGRPRDPQKNNLAAMEKRRIDSSRKYKVGLKWFSDDNAHAGEIGACIRNRMSEKALWDYAVGIFISNLVGDESLHIGQFMCEVHLTPTPEERQALNAPTDDPNPLRDKLKNDYKARRVKEGRIVAITRVDFGARERYIAQRVEKNDFNFTTSEAYTGTIRKTFGKDYVSYALQANDLRFKVFGLWSSVSTQRVTKIDKKIEQACHDSLLTLTEEQQTQACAGFMNEMYKGANSLRVPFHKFPGELRYLAWKRIEATRAAVIVEIKKTENIDALCREALSAELMLARTYLEESQKSRQLPTPKAVYTLNKLVLERTVRYLHLALVNYDEHLGFRLSTGAARKGDIISGMLLKFQNITVKDPAEIVKEIRTKINNKHTRDTLSERRHSDGPSHGEMLVRNLLSILVRQKEALRLDQGPPVAIERRKSVTIDTANEIVQHVMVANERPRRKSI